MVVVTLTGLPVLGLIAFEVTYGFFNLFVHSDIRMASGKERRLGWLLVTPSLHRLHHSERPDTHSKNFGTIFSVWDRLGLTFLDGKADSPVTLGLPGQEGRVLPARRSAATPAAAWAGLDALMVRLQRLVGINSNVPTQSVYALPESPLPDSTIDAIGMLTDELGEFLNGEEPLGAPRVGRGRHQTLLKSSSS